MKTRLQREAKALGITIKDGRVSARNQPGGPIAGADATVESVGELQKRITATRLVLTGPFALAFKKKRDERQLFITITGADDSYVIVAEVSGKPIFQSAARRFAALFNQEAANI